MLERNSAQSGRRVQCNQSDWRKALRIQKGLWLTQPTMDHLENEACNEPAATVAEEANHVSIVSLPEKARTDEDADSAEPVLSAAAGSTPQLPDTNMTLVASSLEKHNVPSAISGDEARVASPVTSRPSPDPPVNEAPEQQSAGLPAPSLHSLPSDKPGQVSARSDPSPPTLSPDSERLDPPSGLPSNPPSSIPPLKQKSLPSAKHPQPSYRERSARFKKKRKEKQTAAMFQSLGYVGTGYPFHHAFRPIPGEQLPNGQSPYPGSSALAAPSYRPLVASPLGGGESGPVLNATAIAELTGTYLGFPWMSVKWRRGSSDVHQTKTGKARVKDANAEAVNRMREAAMLDEEYGRKPRWKPAPEGFQKCAACVWSRRATGYCYLKHGGGQKADGASADEGGSDQMDTNGNQSEGNGHESPKKKGGGLSGEAEKSTEEVGEGQEKGAEQGTGEGEGAVARSDTAPERTSVEDQGTHSNTSALPEANPDGGSMDQTGREQETTTKAVEGVAAEGHAVDDRPVEAELQADAGKESGSGNGADIVDSAQKALREEDERGENTDMGESRKAPEPGGRGEGAGDGFTEDVREGAAETDEQGERETGRLGNGVEGGSDPGKRAEAGTIGNEADGPQTVDEEVLTEGAEQPVIQVASTKKQPAEAARPEPKAIEPPVRDETLQTPALPAASAAVQNPALVKSSSANGRVSGGKRKDPDSADERGPGRAKPCNACRKVRKGGCGTPRAYSGCEMWRPEIREWPRKGGGERELRPWPAHLPPDVHAQIQAGAPDALDSAARAASNKIPYLYFGRAPADLDPVSQDRANASPVAYSRMTPGSYLSRLNQSSSVPTGSPFAEPLLARPLSGQPLNLQPHSRTDSSLRAGPLSQQVSQLFSPAQAALKLPLPRPALLPRAAQIFEPPTSAVENGDNPGVNSNRLGITRRSQVSQSAPDGRQGNPRFSVKVLNPNARTPNANPVVPLSVLPVPLHIPQLPVFRNPPTTSIGAQLLAPPLSSTNQPYLGTFLGARDAFLGVGIPGDPSADVRRIRGGGPRTRKRKHTDEGGEAKKARRGKQKEGSKRKDGEASVGQETAAEAGPDGGANSGEKEGDGTGGRGKASQRRATVARSSEALPPVDQPRRSSRLRKAQKTDAVDEAGGAPGSGGDTAAKQKRRGAGKARGGTEAASESVRQGASAGGKEIEGGESRRGRKRKAESVGEGGEKGASDGGVRKGRASGPKKRKKEAKGKSGESRPRGAKAPPTKKPRGAKMKEGSGKAPLIVFAHGAGAGSSSPFMQRWRGLLKDATGAVDVVTFDYPYLANGKRGAPPKAEKLVDFHIETVKAAQEKHPDAPLVLVGKSMGSRVSCMIGGHEDSGLDVAAVVCLGYPLKGMGKGPLREQTLLDLKCPVLFVQGSKDSMCPLDALADVRGRMPVSNKLYVVGGGDHGLSVGVKALAAQELTKEDAEVAALEAIASFLNPLL